VAEVSAQRVEFRPDEVIPTMQRWLERAVIGLNLCPFAKAVHIRNQIRWVVSLAVSESDLLAELERELLALAECPSELIDTTVLVHPAVLQNFLDYNDFLGDADALLERLGLEGVLQIASFHPDYQFGGTAPDDIENYTNRSPYPCLHLLRESSIGRAVAAIPDPAQIYERNMQTLNQLGLAGWKRLMQAHDSPED
jgi:hypothetical protein